MEQVLFNSELQLLQKTIKNFIKDHVIKTEQDNLPYTTSISEELIAPLQKKAKENGLWLLGSPKNWGGAELSLFEQAVLTEEMANHRFGLYHTGLNSFGRDLPSFLYNCTEKQIKDFIIPAAESGNGFYFALWEPNESSLLKDLKCSARRDGNHWTIEGTKSYVTNVDQAEFGIILVNCVLENGESSPTLFLLDQNDPIYKNNFKLIDVLECHELVFSHFQISDERRIGNIGEGIELIDLWLAESQVLLAARCIGIAKKAMEISEQYAALRITRGKPLSEFPTIRTMLSVSEAELQAARLLVWDAALKLDSKSKNGRKAAEIAKWMATETASKIVDRGLQIHGGAGFTGDVPFERWYKELRIARLDLGSTETLQSNIADSLFIK